MASRAWRLLRLACLAHLGCLVLRLAYGFAARPLLPRGARRVRRASLGTAEAQDIHAAVRRKALEAIATGDLAPGQELELISALDLGTVPWALLPVRFKERLGLPLADRGIDSLALNLSVAVQAKDYAGGVPLHRLTNFHYLVKAEGSPLRDHVRQLVVATTDATELPQLVAWSNMTHRRYTEEEMESWRNLARREVLLQQARAKAKPRWQHQVACLRSCQQFLNASGRDFFVQMATGTGKSLVMSDLLFDVVSKGGRACVVVPKLDLMQQMAQLLEETLPHHHVCRVGTGWQADFAAEVFVCVRNSAWQLQSLTLDLLLLDEAHHYEPLSNVPNMPNTPALADLGVHARHVLSLQARKRVFFTATLLWNKPDIDFGLRPAIEAGVITDYSVMVPVLSEGDSRPRLVEVIQSLPLARKILAFCNTVDEAKAFTALLNAAGVAAGHYNGQTATVRRRDLLHSFARSGALRVLVTVDVLSEGVDLPVADTCLFVAPRRGVRLRQCVGRVLRRHPAKVDAVVIAPPIVRQEDGRLMEEAELRRLLLELTEVDDLFKASLKRPNQWRARLGVLAEEAPCEDLDVSSAEEAAQLLDLCILPSLMSMGNVSRAWADAYRELVAYKASAGHVLVPGSHVTSTGCRLGRWTARQRRCKITRQLSDVQTRQLENLGFVWDVRSHLWELAFEQLQAYHAQHGNVVVSPQFRSNDGFGLGSWVCRQREAKSKGKLSKRQIQRLDKLGFVWDTWEYAFGTLQAYYAEHGNISAPGRFTSFKNADGFGLGAWLDHQRRDKSSGKLSKERTRRLNKLGFAWDEFNHLGDWQNEIDLSNWEIAFEKLQQYHSQQGPAIVSKKYKTPDGFALGKWAAVQRQAKWNGKLPQEKVRRLDKLGFVWYKRPDFHSTMEQLQAYHAEHGHLMVPSRFKSPTGFALGSWVRQLQKARSKGKLSKEQTHRLDKLGFAWERGTSP